MNPLSASSHIILDEKLLSKNIAFIRKQLKEGVTLSAVIKGNGYGHGIQHMIGMLENEGIDHFSVYGIQEAMKFQQYAKPGSQLMIMGYIARENMDWTIRRGYEFFVYDLPELEIAIESAKRLSVPARIHVEVETGMNRTGIEENNLDDLADMLEENKDHLVLSGICTHLAGAESISNYYRIKNQMKRFSKYLAFFKKKNIHFQKRHMASSASAIRFPNTQYDLVRVGILFYGLWPSRETLIHYMNHHEIVDDPLTSILSWKSQIMTLKHVRTGEYIGYGTTYLANKPMTIAIIPVGYAYGYSRALSNQGRVLVGGQRVTVVGTVNMNMMAIDVTEVEGVKIEDEVVLIGFQGENRITVSSFGSLSSQLNYELLARLPHHIPRIIKD